MARTSRFGRLVFACLALALAGCAGEPAADIAARTDPPRIVSLNPCLDAILVEVAEPGQILALSHYSRDPSSSSIAPEVAARYATTGGTVEEILALKPDLVVASTFLAPSTRNALEQLGVGVATFGSPQTIAQSYAQIEQIAAIAGQPDSGTALIQHIADKLPGQHDIAPVTALLWQPGQIVPGEATLVSEMLARNGFASHSAAQGLSQADHVTLEAILADPPEVMLVAGSSRGQQHPLLAKLEDTQVEILDPQLLYCGAGTLIALQQRLSQIRSGLS